MYTVFELPGGRQVEALVLSASSEQLRVVLRGRPDTAEFQLIEGRWTSEGGGQVELGAMLAVNPADVRRVLANAQTRAVTAG